MGYPIFRLEFHLPYSALRGLVSSPDTPPGLGTRGKLRRTPRNLSFLRIPPTKKLGHTPGLYDAHISLVICGSDHTRWTCYAFVDTKSKNVSTGNADDEEEDEQDPDGTIEDPIASDSDGYEIIEDPPIWEPRQYFLRNIDFRMRIVLKEWMYLVRKVEISVEQHVRLSFFSIHAQGSMMYLTLL